MALLDRVDAGRHLVVAVAHLRGEDAVVLGVACGGVPVAFEVASVLGLPLDVLVVGKLEVPGQPGLVMGAVGEDRVTVADDNVIRVAGVSVEEFTAAEATAQGGTGAAGGPAARGFRCAAGPPLWWTTRS